MKQPLLIIVCYCAGIYFLWLDPSNANYKFIFYICSSIPIGILCYRMEKVANPQKSLGIRGMLLTGITALLGTLTAYLMLTDFFKENKTVFILLLVSFIISMVILIIWSKKRRRQ